MQQKFIFIFLLTFIVSLQYVQAQNVCSYTSKSNLSLTQVVVNLPNDKFVSDIVTDISETLKVSNNFIIIPIPNFNNCAATIYMGTRVILYDPEFLNSISDGKKSIITSILAHEVAHHLLGHTEFASQNKEEQRLRELEADYVSAIIMRELGYSLNQAIEGVNKIGSRENDIFDTHPLKEKRNLVITHVFEKNLNEGVLVTNDTVNIWSVENSSLSSEILIKRILNLDKEQLKHNLQLQDFIRGEKLFSSHKYDEALFEFNKLPENEYESFIFFLAKVRKIRIYDELKNTQKALKTSLELEQYIDRKNSILYKISDEDRENYIADYIYFNIAGSYSKLDNKPKALEYLKKVYVLMPNDKITKSKIGIYYSELGNYDMALYFLQDESIVIEYQNMFSPELRKRLYDALILTFEKNNQDPIYISYIYSLVLSECGFMLSDNQKLKYVNGITNQLIKSYEKDLEYGVSVYKIFENYFKPLKKPNSQKAIEYLTKLSVFYKKHKTELDYNSEFSKEIELQKKKFDFPNKKR